MSFFKIKIASIPPVPSSMTRAQAKLFFCSTIHPEGCKYMPYTDIVSESYLSCLNPSIYPTSCIPDIVFHLPKYLNDLLSNSSKIKANDHWANRSTVEYRKNGCFFCLTRHLSFRVILRRFASRKPNLSDIWPSATAVNDKTRKHNKYFKASLNTDLNITQTSPGLTSSNGRS